VIDIQGNRRRATLEDSIQLYKLAQTSPYLDMVASSMVVPGDVSMETATSEQLAECLTLTDMPLTTNPCSRKNARETIDMAAMVWGSREEATETPVSIVSVNPLSPLTYGPDAAGGLMEFARSGQALLVSSMVMAGLNGPVTLAGTAIIEMAESLTGIVLAQLVRPGTPCVFGGTSSSADLRYGSPIIGSPELIKLMGISTQMARFYDLPCRYGGGLTDAHYPDMQAGIESAMAIALSSISGVHFMHQACGILGTYMSMNLEKFVIDEEIGGYIKNVLQPVEISDETLALDSIKEVGGGGNFLTDPLTAERCRTEFFLPKMAQRINYPDWVQNGKRDVVAVAAEHIRSRLESYVKPDIDHGVEKDLFDYIQSVSN
jgi:trimethylamine--corrinoid protein Co-methyltransferase